MERRTTKVWKLWYRKNKEHIKKEWKKFKRTGFCGGVECAFCPFHSARQDLCRNGALVEGKERTKMTEYLNREYGHDAD